MQFKSSKQTLKFIKKYLPKVYIRVSYYDGFDKVTIEKPLNKKIAKIPFYIYDDTIHNYLKRLKTINDNEILMIPDLKKFIKI
jgi:hypothetical protein